VFGAMLTALFLAGLAERPLWPVALAGGGALAVVAATTGRQNPRDIAAGISWPCSRSCEGWQPAFAASNMLVSPHAASPSMAEKEGWGRLTPHLSEVTARRLCYGTNLPA
jgi:hypothetical protein